MKLLHNKAVLYLISRLILCYTLGWLMSGCYNLISRKSEVELTVQDSIGKPLPQVSILLKGYKPDFTHPEYLETLQGITDQFGVMNLTLSWPKGVSYYIIQTSLPYELIDCPLPGNLPAECIIQSDRDLSATIRVRKR